MQFKASDDIPSRIVAAHNALYQIGSALAVGYSGEVYREADGEKYPLVTIRPFLDGVGIPRLGLRASFEMEPNYLALAKFDWEKLKTLQSMPFPPGLRL